MHRTPVVGCQGQGMQQAHMTATYSHPTSQNRHGAAACAPAYCRCHTNEWRVERQEGSRQPQRWHAQAACNAFERFGCLHPQQTDKPTASRSRVTSPGTAVDRNYGHNRQQCESKGAHVMMSQVLFAQARVELQLTVKDGACTQAAKHSSRQQTSWAASRQFIKRARQPLCNACRRAAAARAPVRSWLIARRSCTPMPALCPAGAP